MPVQDAKWLRSGNRVMSPTSTSSPAAPGGSDAVQVEQSGSGRGDELA